MNINEVNALLVQLDAEVARLERQVRMWRRMAYMFATVVVVESFCIITLGLTR